MKAEKRKKLETAGFRVGNAEDFLELTPEERELVDLRLKVSRLVRTLREQRNMTQQQLAKQIASSQSRVAKLESGSSDVSLDLLFRGFFAVGGKLNAVTGAKSTKQIVRSRRNSTSHRARTSVNG
jgi:DNA-binding XRE family transcriptional regulator